MLYSLVFLDFIFSFFLSASCLYNFGTPASSRLVVNFKNTGDFTVHLIKELVSTLCSDLVFQLIILDFKHLFIFLQIFDLYFHILILGLPFSHLFGHFQQFAFVHVDEFLYILLNLINFGCFCIESIFNNLNNLFIGACLSNGSLSILLNNDTHLLQLRLGQGEDFSNFPIFLLHLLAKTCYSGINGVDTIINEPTLLFVPAVGHCQYFEQELMHCYSLFYNLYPYKLTNSFTYHYVLKIFSINFKLFQQIQ